MGHRHRSTARATRHSWDDYLVGVLGLVMAVALGTVAATLALAGHQLAAVVIAVAALACVIPAAIQAVGELLGIALLIGTLAGFVLLLPALAVSPRLRAWARGRLPRATR